MSHNPQPASDEEIALPEYRVLALQGRDAGVFAQAQFMNDVAGVEIGHWQWNGWLTPKGRLVALFALLKLDAERLWLLLPDADPADLATALQRFVFRSKVTLEVRGDCLVSGRFARPSHAREATLAESLLIDLHRIELDFSGGEPRTLMIKATNNTPYASGETTVSIEQRNWLESDLAHGLPRLPPSQAGLWTPQQLSLDRLHAFSVKKGCYPGQEIVARTHFLGQAKRGLALLEADSAMTVGSEVRDGERVLGTIVSAGGNRALAVLPMERNGAALHSDGTTLREVPLLGGLAR